MKLLQVVKEATFDCAHMLSDYDGLCANLHGHTYKVQIGLAIKWENPKSLNNGMLVDYNDLKKAIDTVIKRNYDHATILSSRGYRNEAEQALADFVAAFGMRYTIVPGRTTSENMAISIADNIQNYLVQEGYIIADTVILIKLWETPTSYCEVTV